MSLEITVIKRDGTEEDFSENKIAMSIFSAANAAGGDDFELAEELTEQLVEIIDSSDFGDEISTSTIQEMVEKLLIETGHAKTAKVYILTAADRARIREMDSSLMKSFEDITFISPEQSDMKRENANIDASTAMGTMLKYGSEGAKTFNLLHLISKDIADAHIEGDIHIHDLDFYSLTETCVAKDTELLINIDGDIKFIEAQELEKYFPGIANTDEVISNNIGMKIYSDGKFVRVKNCVSHDIGDKKMLNIKTNAGVLRVTDNHRVTIIDIEGNQIDVKASNLMIGDNLKLDYAKDSLCKLNKESTSEYSSILGIDEDTEYTGKVYDLETENHHFDANGFLVHNCCQIPLDKLFSGGFNTGHGFLREPGSIRTAGALAAIAIQSNQNDQHGGQSIPMFDYYLAPYVALTYVKNLASIALIKFDLSDYEGKSLKGQLVQYQKKNKLVLNDRCLGELKALVSDYFDSISKDYTDSQLDRLFELADKNTYDDTYQSMEAFVHNLNSMHSRAGSQVPFSSVNFGTDTSTEGRYVSKALLETTDRGLGNGEIAIFPISIFKMKAGINFNPGDPNYDLFKLACKVSGHRLYPNFCNLDAPFNAEIYNGTPETEMATMGCRTRVGTNKYNKSNTVIPGRGNLSFTSINLPRIAIQADHDINKFYNLLDKKLELVHRQLLERFDVQCLKKPINYPFLMGQGVWIDSDRLRPKDDLREVLRNGTFGVGFIGLAETLTALIGKHHGESEEAQKLGLEIINHMKEYCDAWSEYEHMNYAVLGTPAESLSGRFVRMDKILYGEIPGVTDKEYYTNSSHVPVSFNISATDKVDIEAPYHALELGGHICYIEMDGDPTKNLKAFMNIVRYMHDKGVGYCAVNHPVDRDPVCGYTGIIGDTCPRCGRKENKPMTMEMYKRIKGYANVGNADTLGVHGNPDEENDRVTNN